MSGYYRHTFLQSYGQNPDRVHSGFTPGPTSTTPSARCDPREPAEAALRLRLACPGSPPSGSAPVLLPASGPDSEAPAPVILPSAPACLGYRGSLTPTPTLTPTPPALSAPPQQVQRDSLCHCPPADGGTRSAPLSSPAGCQARASSQ